MAKLAARSLLAVAAMVLLAFTASAADAWKPADQPDLVARVAKAAALKVEDVRTPVNSIRTGMLLQTPNPGGKSYDLLLIYFPEYGGPNTIVIMDQATGEVKSVSTPRGANFHLCPAVTAPNGKLYISMLGEKQRQKICVYDPAANELKVNALPMPDDILGETHPLVLGTDGKLYAAGAHPTKSATVCQIDPETGKVVSYGPVGPSHTPSDCWAYSAAADDRYVYVASGKVPWYLVALDRQTGKSEVLVTTENVDGYAGVSQGRYGCTASASKVVGTDGARIDYWLYQGKAIPKKAKNEPPPWAEPNPPKPWVEMPPKLTISLARADADLEGNAELWYRPAEAGRAETGSADQLLKQGWKVFRYKLPLYPESIYRLTELPDGRLLGTAGAYEGNFLFDPATGKAVHPGKCHLSHYSTAIVDGKVYMSGYPSSPLYVYDPARPWTAGTGAAGGKVLDDADPKSNPRMLLRLEEFAGTHKMYAAATGADGKVYFGGQWMRNGFAGGLAWYDPKTGKADGFWKPLSNYQVNYLTAAAGGRYIVVSTHRVFDTLLEKPKPEQGRLFVFDTGAGKFVRELDPVKGAKGAGLVIGVGGPRVLGWTENPEDPQASVLYGFDAEAGTLLFARPLPFPLPVAIGKNQMEPFDYRLGPDGKVWTFMGGALVRIDPKDASVEVLGKVAKGGRIAFAGKDVFLAGSPVLRKIAGLAGK